MTPEVIRKLEAELTKGIDTEVQVVYLLAGIRKIIERDKLEEKYPQLKFHSDWALHSRMDRAAAKAILRQFDCVHLWLKEDIPLHALPRGLRRALDRISQMTDFRKRLSRFLEAYSLSPLTRHRVDGWTHFLHLYVNVIGDIPLMVSAPVPKRKAPPATPVDLQHVSYVTVNCELARETIKHEDGEEMMFRVNWTVHDKNGQSGCIQLYNSFSLNPKS